MHLHHLLRFLSFYFANLQSRSTRHPEDDTDAMKHIEVIAIYKILFIYIYIYDCGKNEVMRISRQPFPVKIMIDQKLLDNVESLKYLSSILTNDGRCTCEIKCRIAMPEAAFNKKRAIFTSTLDL